jgi:hypothetical protein
MRHHVTIVFRLALHGALLLPALAFVTGCESRHWVYDRPGVALSRLDQDLARCRRDSRAGWRNAVDEPLVKQCMERLGYTATPAP